MKPLFNLLLLPLLFLFSCSGDPYAEANKLLAEGKLAEAKKMFTELTVSHPKDPRSWLGLGIAKAKLVDHEGALVEYNKAAGMITESVDSIKGKLYFNRGMSYFALANFNECITDMNQAIKFSYNLSDSYAFLGVSQGNTGDEVGALTTLGLSIKENPKNLWALSNRGYYASKLGDNQTAVHDLTLLTQLTPEDVSSWLNLGYTYLQSEDITNAEKCFDKVLSIDPKNFGGIVYKGIVLNYMGRNADALTYFDTALTMDAENASVHYYRGVALVGIGRNDEACMELHFAVEHGEALAARMLADNCE